MRDGVRLAADVVLPAPPDRTGPLPALLTRTPYGRQRFLADARFLAGHGYAVVLQDVRGRYDSDGEWYPFRNEGPDGFDAIEWVARQPWCTGAVGMFGGSYGGWTQWIAARERPPHLGAMASTAAGGQWLREFPYDGGMLSLVALGWLNLTADRTLQDSVSVDWERVCHHLPVRTMDEAAGRRLPVWRELVDHPTLAEEWRSLALTGDDFARIDVPVLHITGWYDSDQPGALAFYEGMLAHSPAAEAQEIWIGPWDHGGTRHPRPRLDGVDFGASSTPDLGLLRLAWFDRWLRDRPGGSDAGDRAHWFLTGTCAWRHGPVWPPPAKAMMLYLCSGGSGDRSPGELALAARPPTEPATAAYAYDPAEPAIGSHSFDFYSDPELDPMLECSALDDREDVVVFTGEPLDRPLAVAGRPRSVLYASSDGPDTDWVVSVQDVEPGGRSVLVSRGRLRARFRESLDREVLMTPGQVHEHRIDLSATGHVFRPGHRVRVTVRSSDFPEFDRNPNTGGPLYRETSLRVAHNAVHCGGQSPSHVVLPVVEGVGEA
jgi:putative CocE/NonD family hydrolase